MPVVALIWGAIIYQLLAPKQQFENVETTFFQEEYKAEEKVAKELNLNYPDPFLKNRKWSSVTNNSTVIATVKPLVKRVVTMNKMPEEQKLIWPSVSFTGTVNAGALITVNNRAYILKQGDTISEVSFDIVTVDSLKVGFKGESKTVYKKGF